MQPIGDLASSKNIYNCLNCEKVIKEKDILESNKLKLCPVCKTKLTKAIFQVSKSKI